MGSNYTSDDFLRDAIRRHPFIIQLQAIIIMLLLWSGYSKSWMGIAGAGILLILYISLCCYHAFKAGLPEQILDHAIYSPASVVVAMIELGVLWLLYQLSRLL